MYLKIAVPCAMFLKCSRVILERESYLKFIIMQIGNKKMVEIENPALAVNEADLKAQPPLQNEIDWEDLLWSLRHLEIRILELLYLPEPKPLALGTLAQRTRNLNYSERTIRRKIQKLERAGLIKVIRSTIMIINPITSLRKNIQNLTILWNHRDRNL